MIHDNKSGFGLVSILFHWICAGLIVFLFGLGIYMRSLDYYAEWYHKGPELHIALGILVFVLMIARLIWRVKSTTPAPIGEQPKALLAAAAVIKALLYLLFFVIVATGYLIATGEGESASFFNLFSIPASLLLSADQIDFAGEIHEYAAWSLIGLVVAHAGAALMHHFFKRDNTFMRMLKPTKSSNQSK